MWPNLFALVMWVRVSLKFLRWGKGLLTRSYMWVFWCSSPRGLQEKPFWKFSKPGREAHGQRSVIISQLQFEIKTWCILKQLFCILWEYRTDFFSDDQLLSWRKGMLVCLAKLVVVFWRDLKSCGTQTTPPLPDKEGSFICLLSQQCQPSIFLSKILVTEWEQDVPLGIFSPIALLSEKC